MHIQQDIFVLVGYRVIRCIFYHKPLLASILSPHTRKTPKMLYNFHLEDLAKSGRPLVVKN